MASDDCRKDDLLEDSRTDSGIDSYRSILKSEEPREPSTDLSGPRDKFSTVEERLDSAYGSSSITVESLSEIVGDCTLSSAQEEQAHISELSEQEENLLTTVTEDGDTYVSVYFLSFLCKSRSFLSSPRVFAERPAVAHWWVKFKRGALHFKCVFTTFSTSNDCSVSHEVVCSLPD